MVNAIDLSLVKTDMISFSVPWEEGSLMYAYEYHNIADAVIKNINSRYDAGK